MSLDDIELQLKKFEYVSDMEKYLRDIGRTPHYDYDFFECLRLEKEEQERLFYVGTGLYVRQPDDDDEKYRKVCVANAIRAYENYPALFEFYDEYKNGISYQNSIETSNAIKK